MGGTLILTTGCELCGRVQDGARALRVCDACAERLMFARYLIGQGRMGELVETTASLALRRVDWSLPGGAS